MHSTRTAALLRAALRTMACAAVALAVLLSAAPGTATADSKPRNPCANRLCTKYKPHTSHCFDRSTRTKISRCFIRRAARHYHQSLSRAYYIAHRESHYNYKVTNRSSGAAGLYQFMPSAWRSTPYRKYSPYNPRWASLAAMWMGKHHGYRAWSM